MFKSCERACDLESCKGMFVTSILSISVYLYVDVFNKRHTTAHVWCKLQRPRCLNFTPGYVVRAVLLNMSQNPPAVLSILCARLPNQSALPQAQAAESPP